MLIAKAAASSARSNSAHRAPGGAVAPGGRFATGGRRRRAGRRYVAGRGGHHERQAEAVFVLMLERGLTASASAAPQGTGVRNHAGASGARWRRTASPRSATPIRSSWCRCSSTANARCGNRWQSSNTRRNWPEPALLPATGANASVRALAQLVACDIHPLNNLRVLQQLSEWACRNPSATVGWALIVAGFDVSSRCWPNIRPPARSATATTRASPTAAWRRAYNARRSAWRSMPTRRCCGIERARAWNCSRSRPRSPSASRTPRP